MSNNPEAKDLVERFGLLMADLENASPVLAFRCVLTWLASERLVIAPCRCDRKDCPVKDLTNLLGTVKGFIRRDAEREKHGEGMRVFGINKPDGAGS